MCGKGLLYSSVKHCAESLLREDAQAIVGSSITAVVAGWVDALVQYNSAQGLLQLRLQSYWNENLPFNLLTVNHCLVENNWHFVHSIQTIRLHVSYGVVGKAGTSGKLF